MGLFGMTISYLAFAVLHFFQFILALTVIGLYGVDLDRARKAGVPADGKWIYAEVVAALAALTALLYMIPFVLRFAAIWIWSTILFILWIALFGLFGNMYIRENPEGNADIQRMKNAVWVVLVNALLWLVGAVGSAAYWWMHRERHSRFTGRAKVQEPMYLVNSGGTVGSMKNGSYWQNYHREEDEEIQDAGVHYTHYL